MKTISKKINQGAPAIIFFAGTALKLEKFGPIFSSVNPCSSLPSVAIDDSKLFQYLNYTGHWTIMFGIKVMRRHV